MILSGARKQAWPRFLAAYAFAILVVGFPFATSFVAMYGALGGLPGLAFGIVAAPATVFGGIAAVSLPFLPVLIWASRRTVGVRFAVTLLSLVYAIALYESVRAAFILFDHETAQQLAHQWDEATIMQLALIMLAVSALFFVFEAVLKFEKRTER